MRNVIIILYSNPIWPLYISENNYLSIVFIFSIYNPKVLYIFTSFQYYWLHFLPSSFNVDQIVKRLKVVAVWVKICLRDCIWFQIVICFEIWSVSREKNVHLTFSFDNTDLSRDIFVNIITTSCYYWIILRPCALIRHISNSCTYLMHYYSKNSSLNRLFIVNCTGVNLEDEYLDIVKMI